MELDGKVATNASCNTVKCKEENVFKIKLSSCGQQLQKQQTNSGEEIIMDGCVKPTRKRYFILLIFAILSAAKSFQWVCLASVTNIIASYYNVNNIAVNWTTIVFMVTFIVLALPITWIMDEIGLRNSVLVGSLGVTIGVVVKCFSCYRGGFWVNMLGHVLVGFAEPFFFNLYSQVASVWFPDHQVSLATSIGILGEEIGIAVGFILPSYLVGNDESNMERIESGLFALFLGAAILSGSTFLAVVFFFDDQPTKAPGLARYKQIQVEKLKRQGPKTSFWEKIERQVKQLGQFLSDKNFNLLMSSFGINVGISYSIHTLLNQMVVSQTNEDTVMLDAIGQEVGFAGFILIISGVFGSLACGHLLDRFHSYKLTATLVYLLSLLSMVLLIACLKLSSSVALYLATVPLGFFLTGYLCVGFEYGVELTYPKPEFISSTLLNMAAQVFGIPISFFGSVIVDDYGNSALGAFFCLLLLIGLLLTLVQRGNLSRQDAVEEVRSKLPEAAIK